MSMDFKNLSLKTSIENDSDCNMRVLKKLNDNQISFKVPVTVFTDFYINSNILNEIRQSLINFKSELNFLQSLIPDKESIDNTYLEKKGANYQKSTLLTEERLKSLLEKYCNKIKIDIDIKNCRTHSRSVATALGNELGLIVATSKQAITINDILYENAYNIRNKLGEIATAIDSGEEQ